MLGQRHCVRDFKDYINLCYLKLWKFFFLSSPRQENMERKSKLKKKKKFLYFQPHKRLFGSAERELNGGERSVS